MPQYQEGQIADGPQGAMVYRGGRWYPLAQQGRIIADPAAPYEAPQAEGQARRTQAEAAISEAEAPYAGRRAAAEAVQAEIAAAAAGQEAEQRGQTELATAMRRAYQTENVLAAIREARSIAREGGTGYESLVALPLTRARALRSALDTIKANLAFDRLQQMRDESETGGAVGNVTERELELLGSTVASLDTAVDAQTFLNRLDRIERNFLALPTAAAGIDPLSEQGRRAMREAGYTGVFDDETPQQGSGNLTSAEDILARGELPEEYQREHLRYLRDNWGRISPESYARFRANLDGQYGLTPDLAAYRGAVENFNALAAQGGAPESMGAVPAPSRERGIIERGLNAAVETAPGAFFANMGNAGGLGIPALMAGNQDELALLRETRPISSALGEIAGGITGSMATGGAMGAIGAGGRYARLLNNPVISDAVYGSAYGATQDTENPLRGAAYGGGASVLGGVIGQRIGQAMPTTFAPSAVRQADEAVPTVPDLQDLAAQQYADVQSAGSMAMPQDTAAFANRMNRVLSSRGRVGPQTGTYIGMTETPLRSARDLVNEFAGQTMTPQQAQTVRRSLSEATVSPSAADRSIAANLLGEFDQWSPSVLPGIEVPNQTASRYLQGQQIQTAIERGLARGERNQTGTMASGLRTQFGQLDDAILRGDVNFSPEVRQAISRTARGDALTNAARRLGQLGQNNIFTQVGAPGIAGGAAYAAGAGPIGAAAVGLGAAGLGAAARRVSDARTMRAAREAELLALGGDAYRDAIIAASQEAGRRAGRIAGGLFGSSASMATR